MIPVLAYLPEECSGNEYGPNVCQRQAKLRPLLPVMTFGKSIVDAIDPRHEEPDSKQEAEAGPEVQQTDLFSVKAILSLIDRLHICVDAISCAKQNSLICTHCKDNGLEEDPYRSFERMEEFPRERSRIFSLEAVLAKRGLLFL